MSDHLPEGRHAVASLAGCPFEALNDEQALRTAVEEAVGMMGATLLQLASHHFDPQGVTAVALLAESHASIHTYPEEGVAHLDAFTCGACDPQVFVDHLAQACRATHVERGLLARAPVSIEFSR